MAGAGVYGAVLFALDPSPLPEDSLGRSIHLIAWGAMAGLTGLGRLTMRWAGRVLRRRR